MQTKSLHGNFTGLRILKNHWLVDFEFCFNLSNSSKLLYNFLLFKKAHYFFVFKYDLIVQTL